MTGQGGMTSDDLCYVRKDTEHGRLLLNWVLDGCDEKESAGTDTIEEEGKRVAYIYFKRARYVPTRLGAVPKMKKMGSWVK